ncbi:MAG: DUF4416 family protein [Planctomycetota bacterium]|jgi:hypothetical protein|nr:DUF4416 family protein [Planctomycetota bacterium]
MAIPRPPEQALFFVGILASGSRELALAADALEREFGPANSGSRVWAFDNTGYYRDELGPAPIRAFLAWDGLFSSDRIGHRKIATNRLEQELASAAAGDLSRPVNLDPGYLTLAKVVLASAKNYAHRIHLHDSIYAEITLQYKQGCFHVLPWTFPDYASGKYDAFFLGLRQRLEREARER